MKSEFFPRIYKASRRVFAVSVALYITSGLVWLYSVGLSRLYFENIPRWFWLRRKVSPDELGLALCGTYQANETLHRT